MIRLPGVLLAAISTSSRKASSQLQGWGPLRALPLRLPVCWTLTLSQALNALPRFFLPSAGRVVQPLLSLEMTHLGLSHLPRFLGLGAHRAAAVSKAD